MVDTVTFTETEIKEVADFLNFVYANAKFELKTQGAIDYVRHMNRMKSHLDKMEKHAFDLKKVTESKNNGRTGKK